MTREQALERASWLSENTSDSYRKFVNDIYDDFEKEIEKLKIKLQNDLASQENKPSVVKFMRLNTDVSRRFD